MYRHDEVDAKFIFPDTAPQDDRAKSMLNLRNLFKEQTDPDDHEVGSLDGCFASDRKLRSGPRSLMMEDTATRTGA